MSSSVTTASYCRICAAACGILVTVDPDGSVTKVRGDPDHPASRGYVCSKGRGLAAWHHRSDRLDHPRLHGERTTWGAALDDLGRQLDTAKAAHGPDSIGLYLATGFAYDAAGQIAAPTWLAMLGSRSFYTAVTVDNAPVLVAAQLVTGHPMLNPVWDPASAGVLVLVGTNPVVSHGYGTTLPDPIGYLREYRERGGKVWVIDPRRTETAAHADDHLPVRPGRRRRPARHRGPGAPRRRGRRAVGPLRRRRSRDAPAGARAVHRRAGRDRGRRRGGRRAPPRRRRARRAADAWR